jgi:hypothetical protein
MPRSRMSVAALRTMRAREGQLYEQAADDRTGRRGESRVGTIAAGGCLLGAVGAVLLVSSLGNSPHYVADFLPGISVLVAVLGTASAAAGLTVFQTAWWIAAGIVAVAAVVAVMVTPRRRVLSVAATGPT